MGEERGEGLIRIVLVLIFLCFDLFSQEPDDMLVTLLQEDLQKYSQIATDTKQNVEYMPYVVSVLKNKELTQLGILSLREALGLIPGVDISIGMAGVKTPIFRGSNPFALGQTKLIIDGIVVNDQMLGAYEQYLDMPIDIIERIEVVRGPGSLLNYVNAYAGSIHVITKANKDDGLEKEKTLFAAFGSDDYGMGGFVTSYKADAFELSSDFFYQRHDKEMHVEVDRYGISGVAPMYLKNYALGLCAEYKRFKIKSRFSQNDSGVSYGQSFSLSEDSSDHYQRDNNFVEASYSFDLASQIKGEISLGYSDESRKIKNKIIPDGEIAGGTLLPDGRYFLTDYKEHTFLERFEFTFSSFQEQTISAGMQFKQSDVEDNSARISDDALQTFTSSDLLSTDGRDQLTLYLHDLISINEKYALELGIKHDRFNDVSSQTSPRIGFVHRYDEENIYKLMFTHSWREPSWREEYLSGSPSVSSSKNRVETVNAYELSYIRRFGLSDSFKLNAYYLDNRDQIHAQNATQTFENSGDGELYGYEAELKTHLGSKGQLYLNYSYVDGSNVLDTLSNTAHHMAKGYYIHAFTPSFSLSGLAKYVGEKSRIEGDVRKNRVDDYATLDVSAVYAHKNSGMTFTASVKNLFDTLYYLPSPNGTYPNDFEQEGVNFLVRMEKRF